jgi:hypothetical protein
MRWKIIVVNATIVALVALLSYVLLATSLHGLLSGAHEPRLEVEQALSSANAQLALDALRLERWLEERATTDGARALFAAGTSSARSEAATQQANRLRDAAVGEAAFARMAPSLVAFVDEQGVSLGRNGSTLMRGDRLADVYPSLGSALKRGKTGSAVWINPQRQEQLLASFVPVRGDSGAVLGAVVMATPLNDERLARTSDLTSGLPLIFSVVGERGVEVVAHAGPVTAAMLETATAPAVSAAARSALRSRQPIKAEGEHDNHVFGATALETYGDSAGVLVAAVPAALVSSMDELLWPVIAVGLLGLILVAFSGVLLGNYVSQPISELEDGLLSIINGNSDLRFQIEHDELGGLVFRINSLLNQLMGVPEDTTDDDGRPSTAPSSAGLQAALGVDDAAPGGEPGPKDGG